MYGRRSYCNGAHKPLLRGLQHAISAVLFFLGTFALHLGPRTRYAMLATSIGYKASSLLHIVPWPTLRAEHAALAFDFFGISFGMAGHIVGWEGLSPVALVALANTMFFSAALVKGWLARADMLLFLRSPWGESMKLQFLLLFVAQFRCMPRPVPLAFTTGTTVLAVAYFRIYGAFDAKKVGPLPVWSGVWSPHEWYHLMVLTIHLAELNEMYVVEAHADLMEVD